MYQFNQVYYRLILEETLNSVDETKLPEPFYELLLGLKTAMYKAINAAKEELTAINTEVNIWRDKLVNAWKTLANILTNEEQNFLNNTILDLTTKYITYMHGCNTGY